MENLLLNNGVKIPQLGLGTFGMTDKVLIKAVECALDAGYRLFDTSDNYKNDISLGKAIKNSHVKREDIIVVSKIGNNFLKKGNIKEGYDTIKERMDLDYIDILLFHWPYPGKFVNAWKEMEKLYKNNEVGGIGVCNCNPHHLDNILNEAEIVPIVNQIELHPKFIQNNIIDYCKAVNIQIMSYTPLARMDTRLVDNEALKEISQKYNKTVPQIIIRWNVQKGFLVIPKAQSFEKIIQNISIFDFKLSEDEMKNIDKLDCGMRVRFDPEDMSRYF